MAKYFPSRKYKPEVNTPAEYPDKYLSAYGWALRRAEEQFPELKAIPKDILLANVLREGRADFGATQSIFDPNSKIDKRMMDNTTALYEAAGYPAPEFTPFKDKKGRSLLEMQRPYMDSDTPEDFDRRNALHALSILQSKHKQFGMNGMLEGWNGKGISKFKKTGKDHANAVMEQKAALETYPDMKKQVFDAFHKGYSAPPDIPMQEMDSPIQPTEEPSWLDQWGKLINQNMGLLQ